jgi:hypothetical protein
VAEPRALHAAHCACRSCDDMCSPRACLHKLQPPAANIDDRYNKSRYQVCIVGSEFVHGVSSGVRPDLPCNRLTTATLGLGNRCCKHLPKQVTLIYRNASVKDSPFAEALCRQQ